MSIFVLNKNDGSETLSKLIEKCKSSSMKMGRELRQAHYQLGEMIATEIATNSQSKDYAVLIMMRAGLFYAYGIADQIENLGHSATLVLIEGDDINPADLPYIHGKKILIVDAVINTGKTILKLTKKLQKSNSVTITTTVIPNNSVHLFNEVDLYTVRTSDNQYIGAKIKVISNGKGPDTGDRLFNTM